jgi:hypothetical protein
MSRCRLQGSNEVVNLLQWLGVLIVGGDGGTTVVARINVLATGRVFAAAANFHHASLVCVFTILTAIFLSLLNDTIASPMATLMFPVIGHKTPFQV